MGASLESRGASGTPFAVEQFRAVQQSRVSPPAANHIQWHQSRTPQPKTSSGCGSILKLFGERDRPVHAMQFASPGITVTHTSARKLSHRRLSVPDPTREVLARHEDGSIGSHRAPLRFWEASHQPLADPGRPKRERNRNSAQGSRATGSPRWLIAASPTAAGRPSPRTATRFRRRPRAPPRRHRRGNPGGHRGEERSPCQSATFNVA